MAERALRNIVTRYLVELDRMGIHAEKALLYGSQSTGSACADSDIDLIVISPDWQPYSLRERLEMLGVAAARILEPVQAQGFTPHEIATQQLSPFWDHILQQASPI